jgi:hypothetical protein
MRNDQKTKQIIIIVIGVTIMFGYLAMSNVYINDLIKGPREPRDFSEGAEYKIDPEKILKEIDQGNINSFMLVSVTPEDYEKLYLKPFSWKQSDYLKITDALFRYTGNDIYIDWSIYDISFYGDCRYESVGLDWFKIVYIEDVGKQTYNAYEVTISSLYGSVQLSELPNLQRPVFGLNSINLDKLKITADDALQIAEENGGRDVRLNVDNKCRISISTGDQDWYVRYSKQDSSFISSIFEIDIDSYTGKYKVLNVNR